MGLINRKDSRFWWAKIWDIKTRGWKSVRTAYRKDDPTGKRKALNYQSQMIQIAAAERPLLKTEAWDSWVPGWLKTEYAYNKKTLKRYQNAWASFYEFLTTKKIPSPRHLKYLHAEEYLAWRKKQTRHCGKKINHNTAVTELKVMSRIMREAHRRDYTEANPFYQLGLKRLDVKVKPELTDTEIETIRKALLEEPAWMRISFEIAIHQGCRLSETQVPLDWVDLKRDTITFSAKGRQGHPHVFTTALHPGLKPLFEKLKKENLSRLACEHPPMAAKAFHDFFKKINLPHVSFHSTRVTVITRMARGGVTQQKAMAYVGHSSETVHRIYQRLTSQDLAGVAGAISFATSDKPGTPDAGQPSPQKAP